MIPVRRSAEPAALVTQRSAGLARAIAALNAYGAQSNELRESLTAYDAGKDALFLAQHRKCVWCGKRPGLKGNPVDHFRPKQATWRNLPGEERRTDLGYWWLTWTWENQYFSCTSCNTGYKQCYFPLEPGSPVLAGPAAQYAGTTLLPEHLATGQERALLIDPAVENPLDHIEWRPVNPSEPKKLWKWQPAHLSEKGRVTIAVLQLARLADDLGDHVRDHLLSHVEAILADIEGGRLGSARTRWHRLAQDVVRSECELAGPTWNALHYLIDEAQRTLAGLAIPPRP